jgi:ATP-dependent RNA helicase DDX21
VEVMHGDIG